MLLVEEFVIWAQFYMKSEMSKKTSMHFVMLEYPNSAVKFALALLFSPEYFPPIS